MSVAGIHPVARGCGYCYFLRPVSIARLSVPSLHNPHMHSHIAVYKRLFTSRISLRRLCSHGRRCSGSGLAGGGGNARQSFRQPSSRSRRKTSWCSTGGGRRVHSIQPQPQEREGAHFQSQRVRPPPFRRVRAKMTMWTGGIRPDPRGRQFSTRE